MTAAWPAISGIQYNTITLTTLDQRSLYGEEQGNPLAASLGSVALPIVTFDVIFTGAELSTFQGWFQSDLALGAMDFDGLEGAVGDNEARYKFMRLPSFTVIRGGTASARLWRATFELCKIG